MSIIIRMSKRRDWIGKGEIKFAPFEKLLGMRLIELGDGFARLEMTYKKDFTNPAGIMHGGAITSLADSAMAIAINTLVDPDVSFFTVKLETKFKTTVKGGKIIAEARVKNNQKRLIMAEVVILSEANEVVAFSKGSFMVK